MLMDQVDTLHVDRYHYWSQVLCCAIMTQLDNLEVKVTDSSQASYAVLRQLLLNVQIASFLVF